MTDTDKVLNELKKANETLMRILEKISTQLPPPIYTPPLLPMNEYCLCFWPEPNTGGVCVKCGKKCYYPDVINFGNENVNK